MAVSIVYYSLRRCTLHLPDLRMHTQLNIGCWTKNNCLLLCSSYEQWVHVGNVSQCLYFCKCTTALVSNFSNHIIYA